MIQVIILFNPFVNNLTKLNYFEILKAQNTRTTCQTTYKREETSQCNPVVTVVSGTVKFKTNCPFGVGVS